MCCIIMQMRLQSWNNNTKAERLFFMQQYLGSDDPLKMNSIQQTRYGFMILNKYDDTICEHLRVFGEWSEGEIDALRPVVSKGDVVLDIGANIGTHTLFFSDAVGSQGHVHSFEPQRIPFLTLCGNVAINSLVNVTTYPVGVGEYATTMILEPTDPFKARNIGGTALGRGDKPGEKVSIVTIDSLDFLKQCNLIKIDVEGMEINVLRGAFKTIQTFRPYLYLEHHLFNEQYYIEKAKTVQEFLWSMHYKIFRHDSNYLNANNFYGAPLGEINCIMQTNILCIPKEKLTSYTPNLPEL